MQSAGKKERPDHKFSQAQLLVGMRWGRWLLTVALLGGLAVVVVLYVETYWRLDPVRVFVVVAVMLPLLAISFWANVLPVARAVRYGYLLRVDERGFHVAGECFVPWPKFYNAVVKYGHALELKLTVDPSVAVTLKGRDGKWPWQWGRPVVAAHGSVIQVPGRLLDVSPRFLDDAVYALCKRYAGQEFWDRNSLARMERQLEQAERLLQVLGSIRPESIRKMPAARQEEILQAGLDALEKSTPPEKAKVL